MSIREQIKELEIQREETKAELFELYAEQADAKAQWINDGISTPLNERLELEADIRDLEAKRQHSKVKLMKLKQQLRLSNEESYRQVVESVLVDGFDHALQEINVRYVEQTQGELK